MATLTALKFDTADGAESALAAVDRLAGNEHIDLQDAAYVTWPEGRRKPQTHELHTMAGEGLYWGALGGFLLGLLFVSPALGTAIGAGIGALAGSLGDFGIEDQFIEDVRGQVTEGTSALFLLTGDADEAAVVDAMRAYQFEIISTNLSNEDEEKLRAAFASEDDE